MKKRYIKILVDFPFFTITAIISLSTRFILLLFRYWRFYMTDSRNRSGFFLGVKYISTFFSRFSASIYPNSVVDCFFPLLTIAKIRQGIIGPLIYY